MIEGYHFTNYNIHDEKEQCLAADLNVFDQNLGLNVALVYASNAPCLECLLAWIYIWIICDPKYVNIRLKLLVA